MDNQHILTPASILTLARRADLLASAHGNFPETYEHLHDQGLSFLQILCTQVLNRTPQADLDASMATGCKVLMGNRFVRQWIGIRRRTALYRLGTVRLTFKGSSLESLTLGLDKQGTAYVFVQNLAPQRSTTCISLEKYLTERFNPTSPDSAAHSIYLLERLGSWIDLGFPKANPDGTPTTRPYERLELVPTWRF